MITASSLYLHFPVCRHLCNYCDFYRVKQDRSQLDFKFFHEYLIKGEETHQKFLFENRVDIVPMRTIFFGGGTPSLWGEEGAHFFSKYFKQFYRGLDSNYEWTMELNPGSWEMHGFLQWLELGVNRISIGVQSYNQQMLKLLDRVHLIEDVDFTLKEMQRYQLNFSIDLMIGLPKSSPIKRDIREELLRLIDFGPSHFSVYILTAKSGYKLLDSIPEDDQIADEYLFVVEFLAKHGYEQYEVSNFAKFGKKSRHNQRYWDSQTVLAVGPSATGLLMKNNQSAIRYKWKTKDSQFDLESLSEKDLIVERIFLTLRTSTGILPAEWAKGDRLLQVQSILNSWVHQGLGAWQSDRFFLLPRGYLSMDTLLGRLLPLV